MKKIIIASDRGGFNLKEAVKAHLEQLGYEVSDVGSRDTGEGGMAYWQAARNLCPQVSDGTYEKGILICTTGMGMSIIANKYPRVYAAVCENSFAANRARAINNANLLCMGGGITGAYAADSIVDAFLSTEFLQDVTPWQTENLPIFFENVQKVESELLKQD